MSDYLSKVLETKGKRAGLMDKCAECGQDYYDTHISNCSKEEDIEMCGICDRFYHNQGKTINNQCICEREGECDKCDATYDVGSQDNRCGNCGNCGDCCTHKGEEK